MFKRTIRPEQTGSRKRSPPESPASRNKIPICPLLTFWFGQPRKNPWTFPCFREILAAMNGIPSEKRPEGFPGQRLVIIPPAIAVQAARQPVTRDLCVTHIGHFSAAGGHHVERPHGTSQHILIACLSGTGTCSLGGRDWNMESGDVLFLPPREHHVYSAHPCSPWTIFWMHFRGLRAPDYLECLGASALRPVISVDDPAVLFEAFEDTFRHATHGFNEAALTALATSFARLLGLIKVHQRTPGLRTRRTENRLLKVLALMREDLARPWTLDLLAGEANMSAPPFHRTVPPPNRHASARIAHPPATPAGDGPAPTRQPQRHRGGERCRI